MVNIKKAITAISLVFLSINYLFSIPVWADDPQPPIAGEYGIVIDAGTGEILYNKNADSQAFPASMTKVLTAIILDERVKDTQMFTVSANAAGQECSCFGLKAGEQISKNDAMYGLLLLSANDLAVTIAENVGGSVQGFAKLMNNEVKKLGLKHTHFVTPNGLHDPDHYTTSHDMALIMKEALKHPEVLNALSTQSIHVHTNLQDITISNTSQVHTQLPTSHVIAGKTGFTDQAGNTLVEYLKDGDKAVIAVVMKTHKIFQYDDIQVMANYAFAHLKTETITSKGELVEKTWVNGQKISLIAADDAAINLKSDDIPATKIEFVHTNRKDIKKGQVVANLKVINNGDMIKEVPLITDKEIKKKSPQIKSNGLSGALAIPVGILFSFVIFAPLTIFKKKRRRRKYVVHTAKTSRFN